MALFTMISSVVATISGLIGVISFFLGNPLITIVCAVICLCNSVIQVLFGGQNGFFTEIIAILVGLVVNRFVGMWWLPIVSVAICIENILFSITGYLGIFGLIIGSLGVGIKGALANKGKSTNQEVTREVQESIIESQSMVAFYCKKCGGEVDSVSRKCTKCGKQYFNAKRCFRIISSVTVVCILCVGIFGWYLYYQEITKYDKLNNEYIVSQNAIEQITNEYETRIQEINDEYKALKEKNNELSQDAKNYNSLMDLEKRIFEKSDYGRFTSNTFAVRRGEFTDVSFYVVGKNKNDISISQSGTGKVKLKQTYNNNGAYIYEMGGINPGVGIIKVKDNQSSSYFSMVYICYD